MSTIDQAIAQSAYTKVPGEIYLSTDRFRFSEGDDEILWRAAGRPY